MSEPPRPTPAAPDRRAVIEAVVASTVGTTIEWYDFFLYGTAAALVFPHLFFPSYDPAVGRILAFGTFAVGFVARPLGGAFFGHLGDRVGRKSTPVATLLLMGVSTFVIGLLPTYTGAGVAAPLALVLLRFLQGVGVGGEWGGAVLLAVEYGHRGKRGFSARDKATRKSAASRTGFGTASSPESPGSPSGPWTGSPAALSCWCAFRRATRPCSEPGKTCLRRPKCNSRTRPPGAAVGRVVG